MVGHDTKWIEYKSEELVARDNKWSFWSLFKCSIEGIVSFSTKHLRIAHVA